MLKTGFVRVLEGNSELQAKAEKIAANIHMILLSVYCLLEHFASRNFGAL
jgi:hypothetical protein